MGRVGRAASLRAMSTAWDAGITLFDTARSYGFGNAEAVLGEFLRGKREQAIVATKFGIFPQRQSPFKRMAVPVARIAMHIKVPGIRKLVRHGGAGNDELGQFTVEGLRESLETSLKQLRTDYVDLLFLHEASTDSIRQQDLMAELDSVVKEGKVRRVGLYATSDVIAEGMANGPVTLGAMQFGVNLFDPVLAGFSERNQRGLLLIGNHPFGGEQRVARVKATFKAMSADETVPPELRDKLRNADWQMLLEAVFGVVLDRMCVHALVFSMMRPDHLRANVRAVEINRFTGSDLALLRERLVNSPAPLSGA